MDTKRDVCVACKAPAPGALGLCGYCREVVAPKEKKAA